MQETPEVPLKGSDLKNQVDELVDVYNDIAQMLGKEKTFEEPQATKDDEVIVDTLEKVCDGWQNWSKKLFDFHLKEVELKDENESLEQNIDDLQGQEPSEEKEKFQNDDEIATGAETADDRSEESDVDENLDHVSKFGVFNNENFIA